MTNYLSLKFKVISFTLICLVVLLHSQIIDLSPNDISTFIQHLFSGKIAQIAVPFFFCISGILFVYNIDFNKPLKSFRKKISKRTRTLLIPYLLWSAVCIITFFLLQYIVPSSVCSAKSISSYNFYDYYVEIIADPKIAYQLWFIRDLFIVSIFSPIIYFLLRYFRETIVVAVFVLYFLWWHIGFLYTTSITFFTLGMYLSMFHKDWLDHRFSNQWWWSIPILWFIFCFITLYYGYDIALLRLVNKILGFLSIWIVYDLLNEKSRTYLTTLDAISFSFIIYILHEPFLTVVKQTYMHSVGFDTIFTSLLFYFTCPIFIIISCIQIGRFTKKYFPSIYTLLSGGR